MAITIRHSINAALQYGIANLNAFTIAPKRFLTDAPNGRILHCEEHASLSFVSESNSVKYSFFNDGNLMSKHYLHGTTSLRNSVPVRENLWFAPNGFDRVDLELSNSQNAITFPNDFNNAYWVKTNVVVTANTTTAPNGEANADTITPSSGSSFKSVNTGVLTSVVGQDYTFSVYAKKGEFKFIQLLLSVGQSTGNAYANFNLENGTFSMPAGISAYIVEMPNGFYKCSLTFKSANININGFVAVVPSLASARGASITGNASDKLYLWGAEFRSISETISSQKFSFNIDCECDKIRRQITWLNKLGGFDSWMFTGNETKSIQVNRITPIEYPILNNFTPPKRIYANRSNESFERHSVFHRTKDQATAEWLRSELINTIDAYVFSDGKYYPILITDTSQPIYDRALKDWKVLINYRMAYDINIQTR